MTRRHELPFGGLRREEDASLLERLRNPLTPLGPGWKNFFSVEMPMAFHMLPASLRVRIAANHLGPSGGWFMRDRAKAVNSLLGRSIARAEEKGSGARLTLRRADGKEESLEVDHIVAATGYDVDVARLSFLPAALASRIRQYRGKPMLSTSFESSVPSLYFSGAMAAPSFGLLLRFVAGTGFAARRIAHAMATPMPARPAGFSTSLDRPS